MEKRGSGDKVDILESEESNYARLTDPRLLLTSLAMRAQVAQDPKATEKEDFARLEQLYERVCRPHTIGQLFNTEHRLDIEFFGDPIRAATTPMASAADSA